jgi:hypothetical protein
VNGEDDLEDDDAESGDEVIDERIVEDSADVTATRTCTAAGSCCLPVLRRDDSESEQSAQTGAGDPHAGCDCGLGSAPFKVMSHKSGNQFTRMDGPGAH